MMFYDNDDFMKFKKERSKMLTSRRSDICYEFGFWENSKAASTEGYLYELRSYELKPGSLNNWAQHWNRAFTAKARGNDNEAVGGFFSDIGRLSMVYHLWKYPNLEARDTCRHKAWSENDVWPTIVGETQKMCNTGRFWI